MTDQRRGMLADIGRRLAMASDDELLVVDRVLLSLERTRETDASEVDRIVLDDMFIACGPSNAAAMRELCVRMIQACVLREQAERAELAESARREIEGEWSGAEQRTEISDAPAQLAARALGGVGA